MERDIRAEFAGRIAQAEDQLVHVAAEVRDAPVRSGGWTRKEIVGHLIDSATNNHQRFVRAALDGSYVGPAYAQQPWVALMGYRDWPWSHLLETWRAQNSLLARAVERIPADRLSASCTVGSNPTVTLGCLIADYLDHLDQHVSEISAAPVQRPRDEVREPAMKTLYMIVERFKGGDAIPVYRRYRDRGRMAPDGLTYVSSWVDEGLSRCYQLMETDDRQKLDAWIANWDDLVDFEVHVVISSASAAAKVADLI